MKGFRRGVSDPGAGLSPPHPAAAILSWWVGKDSRGAQCWMKELGKYPIERVSVPCPNAWISLSIVLKLKNILLFSQAIGKGQRQTFL